MHPGAVSAPEQPPIFVYGSLRSGQSAQHLLGGREIRRTPARMPDLDLYLRSGGTYPVAVENGTNARGVVGEVVELAPDAYADTLASLDRYERHDPDRPPDEQTYVRVLRPTREGRLAWVYVAGLRQADALRRSGIRIPGGDVLNAEGLAAPLRP